MRTRLRKTSDVPHLVWRGNVAYWSRRHEKLPGGRAVKSLETRRDRAQLAVQYAGALNTLCDRGDWTVIARWLEGQVHISEIGRAVREGDYAKLGRLNIAGAQLGEAVDRFMTRTRATLKKRTGNTYESILKQLVQRFGEDYPMAELTTQEAEAFLHAPREWGSVAKRVITWSAHAQANARTIFKALWSMVIEQEREEAEKQGAQPSVVRNPWSKTKIQKRRKTRHSFLTPAQWRHMIEHPDIARTPQAAFLCAGIMGLRRDELSNLRTRLDVVLDVEVPVIKVQPRKGAHEWSPKTENSVRDIPIPEPLLEHFRYHAEHYAGDAFFLRSEAVDAPLSHTCARGWTMRCFMVAGIKYGREGDALTLHSLRHTCATWMLSDGVPLPTVAEWLGDSNEMILSTYGHAIPTDRERAIKAMEGRL